MSDNFHRLWDRAVRDWPSEIDMQNIIFSSDDQSRYTIKDLGLLWDAVSEKYLYDPEEILFAAMHHAIYESLHAAAILVLRVNIKEMRTIKIKISFEKHLKAAIEISELGYSDEDIKIAQKYFSVS